jgi:hypothetical protein
MPELQAVFTNRCPYVIEGAIEALAGGMALREAGVSKAAAFTERAAARIGSEFHWGLLFPRYLS